MVYNTHHEIVEAAKAKRSDFIAIADKHGGNADAIWEDLSDPHSMLDMFEESNYGSQHFDALIEFGRWLRNEEQKIDRNAPDFDQELSSKKSKINEEVGKTVASGHDVKEELNNRLWHSVLYSTRRSIDSLILSARRDLIWDAAISPSSQEKINASNHPLEINRRISEKLREIIPAPFLPVI